MDPDQNIHPGLVGARNQRTEGQGLTRAVTPHVTRRQPHSPSAQVPGGPDRSWSRLGLGPWAWSREDPGPFGGMRSLTQPASSFRYR